MQNWIYKEGKAEGIKEGAEGPDKVGDAVLDLSTNELSAWLALSNGHRT